MKKSLSEKVQDLLLKDPSNKRQLLRIIQDAGTRNVIDADALVMIEGVLSLTDLKVRDIMLPRSKMICICEDQSLEEILEIVTESGHSRFPVTDEDQEAIIGILHAKNLLDYFSKRDRSEEDSDFDLKDSLKPATFIPEGKEVNSLLKDFRVNRYHMAIVVDEYGNASGFITIEDILEEIVGDIEDEFDTDNENFIKDNPDGSFTVLAQTPIEEFNDYFHTEFDDTEFDTIGGLVMREFGHLPKKGETTSLNDNWSVKVTQADERKLISLRMRKR